MAKSPNHQQIEQYLELKSRLMRLVENGGDPGSEDLVRLRCLDASLRGAGINPEELYAESRGRTTAASGFGSETTPENMLRPISNDVLFNRIIEIAGEGFPSHIERIAHTPAGLTRAIERPLILAACGRRVVEEKVAARCHVCHRYECDQHVFHCHADGCHIALCLHHVHFFAENGKNIPLCRKHFRRAMRRRDIWCEEDRRSEKG